MNPQDQYEHLALLAAAHDLIRGTQTRTVGEVVSVDADALALKIAEYLSRARSGHHGWGCWSWGPGHYLCAHDRIRALTAHRNSKDAED